MGFAKCSKCGNCGYFEIVEVRYSDVRAVEKMQCYKCGDRGVVIQHGEKGSK